MSANGQGGCMADDRMIAVEAGVVYHDGVASPLG
jgi:hypothetical protein